MLSQFAFGKCARGAAGGAAFRAFRMSDMYVCVLICTLTFRVYFSSGIRPISWPISIEAIGEVVDGEAAVRGAWPEREGAIQN